MIGRVEEIAALKDALDSDESQFVAVYGRRRVGKTYLIRETLGAHFVFENVGLYDGTLAEELATFRKSLVEWGVRKVPDALSSWGEAFDCLEKLLKSSCAKRKVLFLDEMPWMETPNSGFLKALDHFWNSFATARKDVVLVVCGSAASWIIKKIVRNVENIRCSGRLILSSNYVETLEVLKCVAPIKYTDDGNGTIHLKYNLQ